LDLKLLNSKCIYIIFKNSVPLQRKYNALMFRTDRVMLNGEIIAVDRDSLMKEINKLPGQKIYFLLLKHVVHIVTTVL